MSGKYSKASLQNKKNAQSQVVYVEIICYSRETDLAVFGLLVPKVIQAETEECKSYLWVTYDNRHHKRGIFPRFMIWTSMSLLKCRFSSSLKKKKNTKNFTNNIQFSLVAQSCPTLWDPKDCSTPGLPVHHQLPKFTQTHVHWVGDAIQPSHALSSPSPPTFNIVQHQGLFHWVGSSHQVAKVLEFQFQHQSFNEYSGLILFRMDWVDLLAIQGTLKSLLQHHHSKASILPCSAFFIVQLSHPYMTTGKTIALTRWTFVGKVMSLLFNMLSRLAIAFLPRSKHLLISVL